MMVQLQAFWLANTVTGELMSFYTGEDRSRQASVKGEIRTYAGGRQRAVGSAGASTSWKVPLVEVTAAELANLELWMEQGIVVLARDHLGQYMYGTFFDVSSTANKAVNYTGVTWNAEITINAVDVVEGV